MRNRYLIVIFLITIVSIVILSIGINRADFFYACSIQNYSIQSDDNNDLIIVGCSGNDETLCLNIINPNTLEVVNNITIDGLLKDAVYVENGSRILSLLSEVDGLEYTHDGKLVTIDASSGAYLDELIFQDRMPLKMVVDNSLTYVYVTAGYMLEYEETPPLLYKISIQDLSVLNTAIIDEKALNIALTSDNSKLYINDGGVKVRYDFDGYKASNTEYYYEISVFQASNLDKLTTIELNTPPSKMLMSYDNRLFVTFCCPEVYNDVTLVIIDTDTDQILSSMVFGTDDKTGINFMALDPFSHKLYCTTYEYGTWDPELEAEVHSPSSKILSIDLDDYSHEFISTGIDKLWQIAAVSTPTSCRLFCTCDSDDRKIIYIDP